MVGKFLAYLVCTVMVVLPSVMIVLFLIVPLGGGSIARTFPDLLKDLGLLALGLLVLRRAVGLGRRPLQAADGRRAWCSSFGWEQAVLMIPGYMRRFTVAWYLQSLVPHAQPSDGIASLLQSVFRDNPSLPVALPPCWGWPACSCSWRFGWSSDASTSWSSSTAAAPPRADVTRHGHPRFL